MEIRKIVITGGPCAGKTTVMSWVHNELSKKGYRLLFVPETATELISGGVAPWTCGSNLEYQKCQVRLQMEKERIFEQAARTMDADKVLIVCDRGMLDNKAYMNDEELEEALASIGLTEAEAKAQYDAVFHLTTAAKGALDAYTLANNAARTETPQQAIEVDDKLIEAWKGHPHLRIIDNSTDFEGKLHRVLGEISAFLGEKEPYEIERKFLIRYPDMDWLKSIPGAGPVEIIQTFLTTVDETEVRIRQHYEKGDYYCTQMIKRQISDGKWVEVEKPITENEYLQLMMQADPTRHPIHKDRYSLEYQNQYFQIDIYPEWDDKALVEIELQHYEEIHFPPQIEVIREVTEEKEYTNSELAKN